MQQKVFLDVPSMEQYLREVVASLPTDIGTDLPDGTLEIPTELPNPQRRKFVSSSLTTVPTTGHQGQSQQSLAAWRIIANIMNNAEDIANHHDLIGFRELSTKSELIAY